MLMVQISKELFDKLCAFFLDPGEDDQERMELYNLICLLLRQKQERVLRREAFGRYKAAKTVQERESARKEYLDAATIPEPYRWSESFEETR